MTPAERLRKNQRLLDKAIRELDQQRVKLEKQEKTLIAQIRTSAQKGQMGACKVQAKDLVRTRRCVARGALPPDTVLMSVNQVYREVLRDEESTAEDLAPPPGQCPRCSEPRASSLTRLPSRHTAQTSR